MKKDGASESLGVFSTTLGIVSIALPLAGFPVFSSIVGLILAIVALVLAFKSTSWRKQAFTFAIIGIIINVLMFFWVIAFIIGIGKQIADLQQSGALDGVAAGAIQ